MTVSVGVGLLVGLAGITAIRGLLHWSGTISVPFWR